MKEDLLQKYILMESLCLNNKIRNYPQSTKLGKIKNSFQIPMSKSIKKNLLQDLIKKINLALKTIHNIKMKLKILLTQMTLA